ncbi:hypothetical protein PYCCODRAFT_1427235 [Trametes coccinea BRFM310]|uniref:Uncharacterized protein n=1 Tax=Trametes coccinea (strain BRFM310) TaxID=1353009 RepID=A0A1Y2IFU4_TRAC3|nr:hypothetical protein PYCCODRAFT_1427235 [Trametes coccinea BRFM310]
MRYFAAVLIVFATSALATPTSNFTSPVPDYGNNCKGSFLCTPSLGADCARAVSSVNPSASYSDQAQFSVGHCYMIYATNGEESDPVLGSVIVDTARSILSDCENVCGSYGTNNVGCSSCHVTLNYRA